MRTFYFVLLVLVLSGCSSNPPVQQNDLSPADLFPEGLLYEVIDGRSIRITKYIGYDTSVNIPALIDGLPVTVIGRMTFWANKELKSVSIPSSVTTIEDKAFGMCFSLTNISVNQRNGAYISVGGVLFDKSGETLICCPAGKRGEYAIPSSVTVIGDEAFWYCRNLTRITIPSSVTVIGDKAFGDCDNLTSVTIPWTVTYIGNNAFFGCDDLTSVTIPDSVTYIGDSAFNGCKSLTSVTIPASVTIFGDSPFAWCYSLTNINVDAQNIAYTSVDGVLFNKSGKTLICYPAGKSGEYIIPSSVTNIGNAAFAGCHNLTSITIPQSIITIEAWAFFDCHNLTNVTIPSSVITIKTYAFNNSNLTRVTLSKSTMVAENVFSEGVKIQYRD